MGSGVSAWAFTSIGSFDTDLVRVGPYVGAVSQGGDVLVLTPRGDLVGRARVFGRVDSRPVSDGQSIFVASRDQSIWAFASTGATLWRHRTPNAITAQPTAHEGVIYCHLRDEGMTALNAATGEVLWQNPAAKGNGTMIAIQADSKEQVAQLHAKALQLGGTCEGEPGPRGAFGTFAYFRDLDGNKLCAFNVGAGQ
jgi:outer membrane protein assembly factor BamB